MGDLLSDALSLASARFAITGGFRAGGEWSMRFRPEVALKLDVVAQGSCWCVIPGREPFEIGSGEAVVLNGVSEFVLTSDPALRPVHASQLLSTIDDDGLARVGEADRVTVLGGHVELNPHGDDLLLGALPPVTHVHSAGPEAEGLRALLAALIDEARKGRPGAELARSGYAQLLLVQVLRLLVQQGALTGASWFSLLTDPALRPAVARMHAEPGRSWGLVELSRLASMSRSSFATRFKRVAGVPPLAYLSQWRLRLAQQALVESDDTVAAIAARLGFASESSFSHAFRRALAVSPGRYRRLARMGRLP